MICFFLIFCCSPTTQMHKHLEVHGFDSSTNQSTHKQGGWLDVITSRKSVNINNIDSCISDHKLLFWSCEMLKPFPIYWQLQIIRRNFLDTEKFISEFIIPLYQGSLTKWFLLRPLEYRKDFLIHGLMGNFVLQNAWKEV